MFRPSLLLSGSATALNGAQTILATLGDTYGLAIDFAGDKTMEIKDAGTPANNYSGTPTAKLTYSAPSDKIVMGSGGLLTTITAGSALPYEYSVAGVNQGVLIEEARTSLLPNNTSFSGWTTNQVTVSTNAATSPDGTSNATTLTESAGSSGHEVYRISPTATTSDAVYTVSAYVKPGTGNYVFLTWASDAAANHFVAAVFDLSLGVVGETKVGATSGTLTATSITALTNGWYRIRVSGSITRTDGELLIGFASAASGNTWSTFAEVQKANNSYTASFYCVQAELGATASSPIPTGAAAVTRAADDINLAASAFPTSNVTGTAYAKFTTATIGSGDKGVVTITDANGKGIYVNTATLKTFDGTNTVSSGISISDNTVSKAASSWTTSGSVLAQSANGNNAVSGTFDGTMGASTTLRLGETAAATGGLNGYLQQVLILPRAATTAELKTLTT